MKLKIELENGRGEIVSIEQSKNYINSWKAFLVEKNSRMENHWRNDRVYAQSNPCSRSSRSRDTLLIWIPDELFNGAISLMHRDSSSIKTRRNDVCSTEESSSAFGHGILRFPPPPPPPSPLLIASPLSAERNAQRIIFPEPWRLDYYYYISKRNFSLSKFPTRPFAGTRQLLTSIIFSLSLSWNFLVFDLILSLLSL